MAAKRSASAIEIKSAEGMKKYQRPALIFQKNAVMLNSMGAGF
jgi:hypothetical protein